MDALVPALIAALLAGVGDKPALFAARMRDRYRAAPILSGFLLAQVIACAIAVGGALLVAPLLTPNAKALLLALALITGGAGGVLRRIAVAPDRSARGPAMAFGEMVVLALTDRASFITFALAVRGAEPALAGVGATIGAVALAGVAVTLGSAGWRALPLRWLSLTGGAMLVVVGVIAGLGGLRLI
jgi:putative Ca2+/H+ antiporter (TMEM165/GDT1 family)